MSRFKELEDGFFIFQTGYFQKLMFILLWSAASPLSLIDAFREVYENLPFLLIFVDVFQHFLLPFTISLNQFSTPCKLILNPF